MQEVSQVKVKLANIEGVALRSHQIRAGERWELDGDRPSGFFFWKIEAKRKKHTLTGLLDGQGLLQATQQGMTQLITDAFTKLFASSGVSSLWTAKWAEVRHLVSNRVTPLQRTMLDAPLSLPDLEDALKALAAGKSPGSDGFTKEFYSYFWPDLKLLVHGAVQDAWSSRSMGTYFNSGLICLCPKGGDMRQLGQWRPITPCELIHILQTWESQPASQSEETSGEEPPHREPDDGSNTDSDTSSESTDSAGTSDDSDGSYTTDAIDEDNDDDDTTTVQHSRVKLLPWPRFT